MWLLLLLRFGVNCVDANVPHRLMRTAAIAPILSRVPEDFPWPTLLSRFFSAVPGEFRSHGSISNWLRGALRRRTDVGPVTFGRCRIFALLITRERSRGPLSCSADLLSWTWSRHRVVARLVRRTGKPGAAGALRGIPLFITCSAPQSSQLFSPGAHRPAASSLSGATVLCIASWTCMALVEVIRPRLLLNYVRKQLSRAFMTRGRVRTTRRS